MEGRQEAMNFVYNFQKTNYRDLIPDLLRKGKLAKLRYQSEKMVLPVKTKTKNETDYVSYYRKCVTNGDNDFFSRIIFFH